MALLPNQSIPIDNAENLISPQWYQFLSTIASYVNPQNIASYVSQAIVQQTSNPQLVDVRSFPNVYGNGVNDDTAGLINAFNSGIPFGIFSGTFLISSTVTLSLIGQFVIMSPGALIKKIGSSPFDAFLIPGGASGWQLSGIRINCNNIGGSGIGIKGSGNIVEKSEVYGSSGIANAHGIYLDGQTTTCINNRVINNFCHNVGGVGCPSNSAPDNIRTGNITYYTGAEGITDDLPSNQSVISTNIVAFACQLGGVAGIGIDDADGGSLSSNIVVGTANGAPGIKTQNNAGNSSYLSLTGNTLINNSGGGLHLATNASSSYETPIAATALVVGKFYLVNSTGSGSTDFTAIGSVSNNIGTIFQATGAGTGTGTALLAFTSSNNIASSNTFQNNSNTYNAGSFVVGCSYVIVSIGSTDFRTIGATSNTPGLSFTATGIGSGSGSAKTVDIMVDLGSVANTILGNSSSAVVYDANLDGLNTNYQRASAMSFIQKGASQLRYLMDKLFEVVTVDDYYQTGDTDDMTIQRALNYALTFEFALLWFESRIYVLYAPVTAVLRQHQFIGKTPGIYNLAQHLVLLGRDKNTSIIVGYNSTGAFNLYFTQIYNNKSSNQSLTDTPVITPTSQYSTQVDAMCTVTAINLWLSPGIDGAGVGFSFNFINSLNQNTPAVTETLGMWNSPGASRTLTLQDVNLMPYHDVQNASYYAWNTSLDVSGSNQPKLINVNNAIGNNSTTKQDAVLNASNCYGLWATDCDLSSNNSFFGVLDVCTTVCEGTKFLRCNAVGSDIGIYGWRGASSRGGGYDFIGGHINSNYASAYISGAGAVKISSVLQYRQPITQFTSFTATNCSINGTTLTVDGIFNGSLGYLDASGNYNIDTTMYIYGDGVLTTNITAQLTQVNNQSTIAKIGGQGTYSVTQSQSMSASYSGCTVSGNTLTLPTPVAAGSLTNGQVYQIATLSSAIAPTSISAGNNYQIVTLGSTNFMSIGAPNNNIGTIFTATGVGTGNGSVLPCFPGAVVNAVGATFTATGAGIGTGTAIPIGTGSPFCVGMQLSGLAGLDSTTFITAKTSATTFTLNGKSYGTLTGSVVGTMPSNVATGCSISGNVLTVGTVTSGQFLIGTKISFSGSIKNTYIVSSAGTNKWNLSQEYKTPYPTSLTGLTVTGTFGTNLSGIGSVVNNTNDCLIKTVVERFTATNWSITGNVLTVNALQNTTDVVKLGEAIGGNDSNYYGGFTLNSGSFSINNSTNVLTVSSLNGQGAVYIGAPVSYSSSSSPSEVYVTTLLSGVLGAAGATYQLSGSLTGSGNLTSPTVTITGYTTGRGNTGAYTLSHSYLSTISSTTNNLVGYYNQKSNNIQILDNDNGYGSANYTNHYHVNIPDNNDVQQVTIRVNCMQAMTLVEPFYIGNKCTNVDVKIPSLVQNGLWECSYPFKDTGNPNYGLNAYKIGNGASGVIIKDSLKILYNDNPTVNGYGITLPMFGCTVGAPATGTYYVGCNGTQTGINATAYLMPMAATIVMLSVELFSLPTGSNTISFQIINNATLLGNVLTFTSTGWTYGSLSGSTAQATIPLTGSYSIPQQAAGSILALKMIVAGAAAAGSIKYSMIANA